MLFACIAFIVPLSICFWVDNIAKYQTMNYKTTQHRKLKVRSWFAPKVKARIHQGIKPNICSISLCFFDYKLNKMFFALIRYSSSLYVSWTKLNSGGKFIFICVLTNLNETPMQKKRFFSLQCDTKYIFA